MPMSLSLPPVPPANAYPAAPRPLVVPLGGRPNAASGRTFAIHEWAMPGPPLTLMSTAPTTRAGTCSKGCCAFSCPTGASMRRRGPRYSCLPAPPYTYFCVAPSRYLFILKPRLDGLVARFLVWSAPIEWAGLAVSAWSMGTSPCFWSRRHATFRGGLSWAAKALGVKFPSAECGRFSL